MSKIAMQEMATQVSKLLPKDFGFAILVFPYNTEAGEANYISSANRQDMVKYLRETADRLESKQDYETPNNNIY